MRGLISNSGPAASEGLLNDFSRYLDNDAITKVTKLEINKTAINDSMKMTTARRGSPCSHSYKDL